MLIQESYARFCTRRGQEFESHGIVARGARAAEEAILRVLLPGMPRAAATIEPRRTFEYAKYALLGAPRLEPRVLNGSSVCIAINV